MSGTPKTPSPQPPLTEPFEIGGVRLANRVLLNQRLESALSAAAVGHKAYYRTPVHRQAAMRAWGAGVELPATEQAARTHLAIPLSPVLSRAQVDEVVAAARNAG